MTTQPIDAAKRLAEVVDINVNGSKPGGVTGLVPRLANTILSRGEAFAVDVGGRLCRYQKGVYKPDGERLVKRLVKELLGEWELAHEWSSRRADETSKYIQADAPEIPETPPTSVLNVTNGLLDITDPKNPKLLNHSPEHLSLVQLPIDYDPAAECPELKSFVMESAPDDCENLVFEILGVLIVPGLGKRWAILLVGEGGTGKSTFLIFVKRFLGPRLVSALPLQHLEANRFATSRLVGKLANIYADLPDTHLETTSVFRTITGGDPIPAEFKHRDGFDFEPSCRLLFSANHYPRSADASSAFFERWIVLPFDRKFRDTPEEITQEELVAAMTTAEELSGALNMALQGRATFMARGQHYEVPASVRKSLDEFRATTDPLAVWLTRNLVVDADAFIIRADLLQAYNDAAKPEGYRTMNPTSFGIALRQQRPDLFNDATSTQKTVASGRIERVWTGVGLMDKERSGRM